MSLKARGFGQTAAGFNRPTVADILADRQQNLDQATGLTWRKDGRAIMGGQILGSLAAAEDEVWGELQANYAGQDPRQATGARLDGLCALDDIFRAGAVPSTGTQFWGGTAGTVVNPGDIVESQDNTLVYGAVDGGTLALATARTTTQTIAQYAVYSNSGNVYVAMVGGITGGGAGPSGTGAWGVLEIDGTVSWQFLSTGPSYLSGPIASTTAGPIAGNAGQLTKIGTLRVGLNGTLNVQDVAVGRLQETDAQLAIRRISALAAKGRSTLDAGRAALLDPNSGIGATGVQGFENTTKTVDAFGRPANTFEYVVVAPVGAPVDLLIAQTILGFAKAAGMGTYGTTTVNVSDAYGIQHAVSFTRPVGTTLYCTLNIRANSQASSVAASGQAQLSWPADGPSLASAAALAFAAAYKVNPGMEARHSALEGAVWGAQIPGMLAVTAQLDTVPITSALPGQVQDVAVDPRHFGDLESANVTVVVSFERP